MGRGRPGGREAFGRARAKSRNSLAHLRRGCKGRMPLGRRDFRLKSISRRAAEKGASAASWRLCFFGHNVWLIFLRLQGESDGKSLFDVKNPCRFKFLPRPVRPFLQGPE